MRNPVLAVFGLLLAFTDPAKATEVDVSIRFSPNEVSIMRDFFHERHASDQGGNKGRKSLPPGIAKNLARGKPVPPGIAKQALPDGLIARLPPAPKGFERVIIAGKVLLVEIATQVVHDILADVILD